MILDRSSIAIIEADLAVTAHANAIIMLMDEYARDPMGGGDGLSNYAKNNLISALAQRTTARVILAFVEDVPAGLVTCLDFRPLPVSPY
jgi:hypothetical protein